MERIEKYRKIFKWVQTGGMIFIIGIGMLFIYLFGIRNASQNGNAMMNSITYVMLVVLVLFFFLTFAAAPMQNKLLKMIIIESLNGLEISNLKFDRKKGYSKESFLKLNLAPATFSQFGNADYYSFDYKGLHIESTTIRAFDEYKIPKQKGVKKSKARKEVKNYFHGRIYIIPFDTGMKLNIYGRKDASFSKKKELVNIGSKYQNEIPLKIKKYNENFEIFYNVDKPLNVQPFIEKLFYLKMQAKGLVSCFLREGSIILAIDNGHFYKEVDFKEKIDENLIRQYRKDVSMVLSFINSLNKGDN